MVVCRSSKSFPPHLFIRGETNSSREGQIEINLHPGCLGVRRMKEGIYLKEQRERMRRVTRDVG